MPFQANVSSKCLRVISGWSPSIQRLTPKSCVNTWIPLSESCTSVMMDWMCQPSSLFSVMYTFSISPIVMHESTKPKEEKLIFYRSPLLESMSSPGLLYSCKCRTSPLAWISMLWCSSASPPLTPEVNAMTYILVRHEAVEDMRVIYGINYVKNKFLHGETSLLCVSCTFSSNSTMPDSCLLSITCISSLFGAGSPVAIPIVTIKAKKDSCFMVELLVDLLRMRVASLLLSNEVQLA